MSRISLILLPALVLPTLFAQTLPDADALLKAQAAALKDHRSLQYVTEFNMEMAGPMATKVNGEVTMAMQQPGKMRMESKMMGMGITMVSDGETTIAYNSMLKQYVKQNAALGPEGIISMMGIQGMPDMAKIKYVSKTLRDETIEMAGEKHDCWVVQQTVDRMDVDVPGAQGSQISDMLLTYWLDKKLALDLKMTVSMKMKAMGSEMAMKQEMIKKSLTLDEPVPDSTFAFTVPDDAKEVPTLMGSSMPKADLIGKDATPFDVKSLDGKPYSLDGLKGKPVLLDFWATWCGPCKKSLPVVDKMYQDFKDQGLTVLAVDAGEDRAVVESFLKKTPLPYAVVLGGQSSILKDYAASAYPTFVMIGRDGKIVAQQIGFRGEAELRDMAKQAGLTAPPAKEK